MELMVGYNKKDNIVYPKGKKIEVNDVVKLDVTPEFYRLAMDEDMRTLVELSVMYRKETELQGVVKKIDVALRILSKYLREGLPQNDVSKEEMGQGIGQEKN